MAASVRQMKISIFIKEFLLILLSSFLTQSTAKSATKHVTTVLNAKWAFTPIILEASEFLADENIKLFWDFIESITEEDPSIIHSMSDKASYEFVISKASKIIIPSRVKLLKFILSLRVYSPKVQMFQQMSLDQQLPEKCEAIVSINGKLACDHRKVLELIKTADDRTKSLVYKIDHHYPKSENASITAILYGQLGTAAFEEFHRTLKDLAIAGKVDYIPRHYVKEKDSRKVHLSGYGVELAIKSTEYKAKDDSDVKDDHSRTDVDADDAEDELEGFLFSTLKKLHPELKDKLDEFRNHLLESSTEMEALKVWQFQDLSFQAAQRTLSSPIEDALRTLRDLSQNFPSLTKSLVHTQVKQELRDEILQNQQHFGNHHSLSPGESALFINGLFVDLEVSDIFSLLDIIKEESKTLQGLQDLELQQHQISQFLRLDLRQDQDKYAVDFRLPGIIFINDLENDKRYGDWGRSVQELLRPVFPGMMRSARRNFFNLVFVLNPAQNEAKDLIKMAESFFIHRTPIRIGFVFAGLGDLKEDGTKNVGIAMVNAFNFIRADKNINHALSFLTDIYSKSGNNEITLEEVLKHFAAKNPREDFDLIFGPKSDYNDGIQHGVLFVEKTGLSDLPQVLINGVPLDKEMFTQDAFEEAVVTEILRATVELQKRIYYGDLNDNMDVTEFIMTRKNVVPRLNSWVLTPGKTHVDVIGKPHSLEIATVEHFANLKDSDMAATLAANLSYLTKNNEPNIRTITIWIVTDLDTSQGRLLFYNAIKFMKSMNIRIAVIHNSDEIPSRYTHMITRSIQASLTSLPRDIAKKFVTKLLKPENVEDLREGHINFKDLEVHGMEFDSFEDSLSSLSNEIFKIHRYFCQSVIKFKPGQRGLIVNGRIIGPFHEDETFTIEDFNLLEKFTTNSYVQKIYDQFQLSFPGSSEDDSDILFKIEALMMSKTHSQARHTVKFKTDTHSVIKIEAKDKETPAFEIDFIVDPATRAAQKISPILLILQDVINVEMKIYMNCQEKLSDLPLKSFYRFVLESELQFSPNEYFLDGPLARFSHLPQTSLLTLNMDTPEGWLVEAILSPYDLDNIHLKEVKTFVHGEFELEYLLLEGHCYDLNTGQPPRGLQFTLGTKTTPVIVDTIVMANLGYFQLKANPGTWLLRLRQGRSQEIYDIASHEGTDSSVNSEDIVVVLDNFQSKIIKVKVNKKPDKVSMDLLSDDGDDDDYGGLWTSISNTFSGKEKKKKDDEEVDKVINIFSLASGHLYERFLRIMMLSVLKHATIPVKFWFLKNYLSPNIKEILPYMAKEYDFEYELVQYKWPRWLHQQTEKQRIIWGYKILFLDVLFPLDVKKIIFVDADQVVRADMKELRDLDLEGAPYGYTPFCESRKEMDGFRFWKSGYWDNHLAGRKYHISALYVVDLKKFRKIAAGDRLRGQYQGLSQDPNSLSNLDQDLPNNMIHQVNIKSLPQEWLWCETWCDDVSKAKAKTIDLCNNPQTKEPKLTSAMRIIGEWIEYDNEIKEFLKKIVNHTSPIAEVSTTNKDTRQQKSELPRKEEL